MMPPLLAAEGITPLGLTRCSRCHGSGLMVRVRQGPRRATRAEEVFEHLGRISAGLRGTNVPWPWESTQEGIAHALGISRGNAAVTVRRLEVAGRVEVLLAHVATPRGVSRRRKVYRSL